MSPDPPEVVPLTSEPALSQASTHQHEEDHVDIVVTGRHLTVSDRFRAHIEEKLAKITQLSPAPGGSRSGQSRAQPSADQGL